MSGVFVDYVFKLLKTVEERELWGGRIPVRTSGPDGNT
jgi:hypothetical protein